MRPPIRGDRSGMGVTAIAVVLIAAGASFVGVSIASQRRAPQPPPVTASTSSPVTEVTQPSTAPSPTIVGPTLSESLPVSLDIPSIDVHSEINPVGRTADGALEVPAPGPLYDEAAWYRHSPTPGSLGPAIVLGHVDSAANGPSVFFRLGELRPRDKVMITRTDGSVAVFVVDEVYSYAKDDFPTKTVYGDIDHAGLRIVTCGGAFDDLAGHYLDNVVVFASLADPS